MTADDVTALLDAADAAYAADRLGDAEQLLGQAFRELRSAGEWQRAARVAIDLACLCSTMDRMPVARGWVERTRTVLEKVGPCVEHGYLELAVMACERPDLEDLLASAERALAVALDHGDSDLEARALADSGLALVCQGRLSEGFSRLDAALTAVVAGEVTERSAAICLCSMLTACDRAADLLAPFEDQLVSCEPLARLHHLRGDGPLAAAVLERGLRTLVGDVVRSAPLLSLLVEVHLGAGEHAAAGAAAAALARGAAVADVPVIGADAALAEARVAAATGDVPTAKAAYGRAAVALGAERPHRSAVAQLELAELLADAGEEPAALAEARAALACFRRLGATRDRDRAAALLRRLGDRGGGRPAQDQDLVAALSPRELEVLGLLAAGLTNAAIAERLYISPKTAEHHVGRVLSKLGLRRRAEAAALAVRLGVVPGAPTP